MPPIRFMRLPTADSVGRCPILIGGLRILPASAATGARVTGDQLKRQESAIKTTLFHVSTAARSSSCLSEYLGQPPVQVMAATAISRAPFGDISNKENCEGLVPRAAKKPRVEETPAPHHQPVRHTNSQEEKESNNQLTEQVRPTPGRPLSLPAVCPLFSTCFSLFDSFLSILPLTHTLSSC